MLQGMWKQPQTNSKRCRFLHNELAYKEDYNASFRSTSLPAYSDNGLQWYARSTWERCRFIRGRMQSPYYLYYHPRYVQWNPIRNVNLIATLCIRRHSGPLYTRTGPPSRPFEHAATDICRRAAASHV